MKFYIHDMHYEYIAIEIIDSINYLLLLEERPFQFLNDQQQAKYC